MSGEARRARVRALLRRAGVAGLDSAAVMQAFVHSSAARERVAEASSPAGTFDSNERLEFLGDTIIGYAVARWLYARYPNADEGELALRKASLVSDVALAQSAARLHFDALVILGAGQAQAPAGPGRSILADAFEAFVAALSEAAGIEVAARFVEMEHVVPSERAAKPLGDPKTLLQEWTQKHHRSTPTYADRYEGPAHARTFHAKVWVAGEWLADGWGPSKKEAQRAAALQALDLLGERHGDAELRMSPKPLKSSRRRMAKNPRT
jgi:ribonuclease III